MRNIALVLLSTAAASALSACGDDDAAGTTTTTTGPGGSGGGGEGGAVGGSGGAGGSVGGGGGAPFVPPTPFAVALSGAGPDQLQSVTPAPGGGFLAAGFAAQTVGGPRLVTVVKLTASGLDTTWGTSGVVTTAVVFAGGNDEVDITTQSDGRIVVSATVANPANPNDRDVAVLRLLDDGTLDATFGTAGVATLNLNDAHDDGMMLVGLDASRSLTVNDDDEIFVHALSRGLGMAMMGGPRTDTDFTVVKLTPDGAVDDTFGDGGQLRLDIQEANATARLIRALPDGSLLAGGYANTPDVGSTQPVLYKLTAAGDLDTSFATGGYFHDAVLATQTEIYGFAIHGPNLVTGGYGRNSGDTNDYVSLRFDVATGERDSSWGGAQNGAVLVDPSGMMLGSNARGAVGLPNGSTLIHGSTGPSNVPEQDAVFIVLDDGGALDTDYGTGIHVFQLGDDGSDQFWGGAVSGSEVALVGYQGGGQTQTDTTNDDAYAAVFEIP
jgi:uncharacterized delta-60 repeat protein